MSLATPTNFGQPSWLPQNITQAMIQTGPGSGASFASGTGGAPNYSLNLGGGGPGYTSLADFGGWGSPLSVPLAFGPSMTQGGATYNFNPSANDYTLSGYSAPQKSDAGNWQDKLTQAATIAAMAYGGGLIGGQALGLTGASTAATPSYLDTPALPASDFAAGSGSTFGAAAPLTYDATGAAASIPGSEQAALGQTYLPATTDASVQGLDPTLAGQFGFGSTLTPGAASLTGGATPDFFGAAAGAGAPTAGDAAVTQALTDTAGAGAGAGGGGYLNALGQFVTNPKNLPSLGLGALSLVGALSKPKLPSQLGPATATNTTASNAANAVISGGGTASPNWAQQKSSIDASIAQQLQQQSEQLKQNAANTGQQGMVVEQQLNALQQTLETQRQQLYEKAQADNVNQAITEMTGSNTALVDIARLQLGQDQAAQQASNQLAQLALLLASKG